MTIFLQSTLEFITLQELTDDSKNKVSLISDISKAEKLAGVSPMNSRRFDMLYELDIAELVIILDGIQTYARYQRNMEGAD